jgi:Pyruvate/2-oxoacid:ferredoxin oxidoreductase delta subunit
MIRLTNAREHAGTGRARIGPEGTAVIQAVIIAENCTHDPEMCMAIPECAPGALLYVKEENGSGHIQIDPELCTGCGTCADICCGDAIVMEEVPVTLTP